MTLSGTNSFTGAIAINGGTLIADTAGIDGTSTTSGIAFGGGTLKALDSGGINTNKAISATSTILLDTTSGAIFPGRKHRQHQQLLDTLRHQCPDTVGHEQSHGRDYDQRRHADCRHGGDRRFRLTSGIAFGGGTLKALDSGGINTNKAISATSTILLDTSSGPITLDGNIASTSNSLTLSGAITLVFSGVNSYAGGTLVKSGILIMTAAADLLA